MNVHEYPTQRLPARPPSVTVIAVAAMIFGAIGLVWRLMQFVVTWVGVEKINPQAQPIPLTRDEWTVAIISTIAGSLLGSLAFASGVGALWLRRWAWRGLVIYSIGAALFAIAQGTFQFIHQPQMIRRMADAGMDPAMVERAEKMTPIVATTMPLFFVVLSSLTVFVLTRRSNRRAFGL